MTIPQLHERTIERLAGLFRDGGMSADGACEMFLETIGALDGAISAIRGLDPSALREAERVGRSHPSAHRPLSGVPILLKDNIDLEGLPTTSGCVALAAAFPERDAAAVRRLKTAGAVLLGKTNLSEFSFEIRSRSSIGGDVLNPFNPEVTAGGSSGGAAAAVAAGFAPAAIGTDTGGSIRTPAAYNGLVGFRPTWGLIDRAGVAPLAPSTDTVGLLAHTVSDVRLLLSVLTGEITDPSATPKPKRLEGVRFGVLRQAFGADPEVTRAGQDSLAGLSDAGATLVDPVTLPSDVLPIGRDHVVDFEFATAFDGYLATNFREGAPPSLAAIIASGDYLKDYDQTLRARATNRDPNGAVYQGVLAFHARLGEAITRVFESKGLDALIYPTSAVVPTSLDNPRGGWAPELAACSGRPAISLPIAQSGSAVPIGIELLGKRGADFDLLALAARVDAVVGRRFMPDLDRLARLAAASRG